MRRAGLKILSILIFALSFGQECTALNITIDPGHGGDSRGCFYEYDGTVVEEKDLNIKIAMFLKDELNKYQTKDGNAVNVYFTRNQFENPSLKERIEIGKAKRSDVIISLHNNASSDDSGNYRGCMALVTSAHFNNKYDIEANLASNILAELNKLGIVFSHDTLSGIANNDNGLLRRLADNGDTYPNGEIADWYGIVMHGIFCNIPSIIIEHAYLDNEYDYRKFLCSDEKLKQLALADANGIIKYYGLVAKGSTTPPVEHKKVVPEVNNSMDTKTENNKPADANYSNDKKTIKETPNSNNSSASNPKEKISQPAERPTEPVDEKVENSSPAEEISQTVECFNSNSTDSELIDKYNSIEIESSETHNDKAAIYVWILIFTLSIATIRYYIIKRAEKNKNFFSK